jgi:hypothetical protein
MLHGSAVAWLCLAYPQLALLLLLLLLRRLACP